MSYKNTPPPSDEIAAYINSPEFKKSFRQMIVDKAIKHNSSLTYRDDEGRMVQEWPATGIINEVELTNKGAVVIRQL